MDNYSSLPKSPLTLAKEKILCYPVVTFMRQFNIMGCIRMEDIKLKRILCYGDSNTHGCNPEWTAEWENDPAKGIRLPEEERWTGILQAELGTDYRIIEEGLPGRTTVFTDPIYPYCDGRAPLMQCIASQSPIDLFLIMLGTNDLKVTFRPSEDTVSRAMEEFLKQILNPYIWEHRIVPPVLLVSPVQIRENIEQTYLRGMYNNESVRLSTKLGSIYKSLADRYGCCFLDAAQYAEASEKDALHMNPENHRKLAKALEKKIKEIIG